LIAGCAAPVGNGGRPGEVTARVTNPPPVELPPARPPAEPGGPPPSRGLLVAAWATGPAALYALLSLAHAGLAQGILTVDVGFGRSLAFWVLGAYLALLLWGFLPRAPRGWIARRGAAYGLLALGGAGALVCGGFTLAWLVQRWSPSVAPPVLGALAVMLLAALGTLWVADRTERGA
jgi:hypothetical protein